MSYGCVSYDWWYITMPVTIKQQTYYRTAEVCGKVGVSRNTLFRWLKEGTVAEPECRDRRGWRLFTDQDIERLKAEAYRTNGPRPS